MNPNLLYFATKGRHESGVAGAIPRSLAVRQFVDLCGGVSEVAGMSKIKSSEIEKSFTNDGVYVVDSGDVVDFSKMTKDDADNSAGNSSQPASGNEGLPFVARYNTIMTTSERDREGDILRSSGAKIDGSMPVLWQHMPYMPIGRLIKVISQDDNKVEIRNGLAGVSMIADVMVLMDCKALRTSHGFRPIKYDELRDEQGNYLGGYDFEEYAVMESSLVSVPANAGAIITGWENNKFITPIIKAYGQGLFNSRQTIVKGGWDKNSQPGGLNLTVNINGDKGTPATQVPAPVQTPKSDESVKDANQQVKEGIEKLSSVITEGLKGILTVGPVPMPSKTAAKKKDGDGGDGTDQGGTNADGAPVDDPKPKKEEVTNQDDGTGKAASTAEELSKALRGAAGGDGVPVEAKGRLTLAADLLDEFNGKVGESCDMLAQSASTRDIPGIVAGTSALMSCSAMLPKINEELARTMDIENVPDDIGALIACATEGVNDLMMMMNWDYDGDEKEEDENEETSAETVDGSSNEPAANDDTSEEGKSALIEFEKMLSEAVENETVSAA